MAIYEPTHLHVHQKRLRYNFNLQFPEKYYQNICCELGEASFIRIQ